MGFLRRGLPQLDVILQELTTILAVRDKRDLADALVAVPLAQVLHRLHEPAQHAEGTISVNISPDLVVQGTYIYLFNIFRNLLVNAIAYARRPGRCGQRWRAMRCPKERCG